MNGPDRPKRQPTQGIKKNRILNNKYYLGHDILGQGAFGRVFKAIEIQPGRTVAIKELRLKDGAIQDDQQNEINLLKQIKHTNIMRYYDHFVEGQFLYIVSEYLEGGSLQDNFKQYGLISEEYYSHIMTQVLLGLIELHNNSILHRDLKAANLLQDKQGIIKITDLGIATKLDSHTVLKEIAGTPFWMAREVLLNQQCNEKADIWSLGATLFELLSGAPPYFAYTPMAAMYEIATCTEVENVPTIYPDAYDFMQQCFIFDVEKRPSASQLLNHKFIQKYQKNLFYIKQNLKNKSEEVNKKMKLLFWETKDISFKKQENMEFSLFSDDSDGSDVNFFEVLNKAGSQKQSKMIMINIAKEQLKCFFEKKFTINTQINQYRDERNKEFAYIFMDELEKKYSVQMFIEGFRHFKNEFEQIKLLIKNPESQNQFQTVYNEFINFLRFIIYLIEESNQQIGYIQLLLQYNVLEVFEIFNLLSSQESLMQAPQNEAFNLSMQVLKLLQIFYKYISIYPLFSSHGGLSIILSCQYFSRTNNFQLLEQIINFISVYTQQNHMVNDKVYENMFKEEYLGSLAQTISVSENILKIIQRLMRYNCSTKMFEQNEYHFIIQADSTFETLQLHQQRKQMILKLLYLLQDIYQYTSQQNLLQLYEQQSGTIIEIVVSCLDMIQFIEQQKNQQPEIYETVRHETTEFYSSSSTQQKYVKKYDKKGKSTDEDNVISRDNKNFTCDLSNLLSSASEFYNKNKDDDQIESDLQSLITYSNFLIDAYQNILFQHKRIGADRIDHNFMLMKMHLGSLLKISQSKHFRQKIQLLLYYIVQNNSDFLFQNLKNAMLYNLLLSDKESTFIQILIIDGLSKAKFIQITKEYIDCLEENKVFDKMFQNFDNITIISLYSKFCKLYVYCSMPIKELKDVLAREQGTITQQSIISANQKQSIKQLSQQRKQVAYNINKILQHLSNSQYLYKIKSIFQYNMNNEKICEYFETSLAHFDVLRKYIEASDILPTIAYEALMAQNTVSRQLKIQMIYLIYIHSKHPREFVRKLNLREQLNDYLLTYDQNEQVIKLYLDIIDMQA